jgi:hypothetical protein
MRVTMHKFSVLALAIATIIALAVPNDAFAQRGGGGGGGRGGGGGHGGGHASGGRGGGQGGGGQGEARGGGGQRAGNHPGGGNRGSSGPNWSDGNSRDNQFYGGDNRRDSYSGNYRRDGRPAPSNVDQIYRGFYGSGYRGDNFGYRGNNFGYGRPYGYGRPGFGPGYGAYGYGYFPWYVGLAAYGAGLGRGYGYGYGGYNDGYVVQSAPVIVERSVGTPPEPPTTPQNDYVPQMNRTTTVLGAQSSGAAVLGVTMDPQYPNAAVVREVTPGSAAEKGGLRAGDMITSIDKTEIRSPADVTNLVASRQVGDQLEIAFIRPVLRSEVKEAAPEQGLGITAPATPAPADQSTEAPETIPPPVPQPTAPQAN